MSRRPSRLAVLLAAAAAVSWAAVGCGSSGGAPKMSQTCTAVSCGAASTGSGPMQFCTTSASGGTCTAASYLVDGLTFDCASCVDCAQAQAIAEALCLGAQVDGGGGTTSDSGAGGADASHDADAGVGADAGGGVDAGGGIDASGEMDAGGGDAAGGHDASAVDASAVDASAVDASAVDASTTKTTCTATAACGTNGATYTQCTTSVGGMCQSSDYATSDGHVYACTACGDCTTALTEVESYCTSLSTTTSCTIPMTCGPGGLTFKECATDTSAACVSQDFELSDGTVFPCPACDCTTTLTGLKSYCSSLLSGAATTTCQKAAPCDASGTVTFESCQAIAGTTCENAFYKTSTGNIYPWTSCTNNAVAEDYVVEYCASLGGVECSETTLCTTGQTCCSCPDGAFCAVLSAGATCEDEFCP